MWVIHANIKDIYKMYVHIMYVQICLKFCLGVYINT